MSAPPSHNHARILRGLLVALLLVGMAGVTLQGLDRESAHYDETEYIYSGHRIWSAGDLSVNPHPPAIKGLAGLGLITSDLGSQPDNADTSRVRMAWKEGRRFLYHNERASPERLLVAARRPMVALWVLMGLAVYLWSARMYGVLAGFFSLGLFCLCPNVLSQGRIVSTDLGLAAFGTIALLGFYLACERPCWWRFCLAGLPLGLALGSRHQGLLLVAVMLAGSVWLKRFRLSALMVGVGVVVLIVQYKLTAVGYYWQGFQFLWQELLNSQDSYLLAGEISQSGWYRFFPLLMFYKLPPLHLLTLLLTLLSLAIWRPRPQEWICLAVALSIFGLAVVSRINYAFRHVLIVLPLLYMLAGRLSQMAAERRWVWGALAIVLLSGVVELVRVHPHQLSYVTPLAGGPAQGYRLLAHGNLDNGQDIGNLGRYLSRNGAPDVYLGFVGTSDPNYYGIRYRLLPGKWYQELVLAESSRSEFPGRIAVSASYLRTHAGGRLDWLLDEKPEAMIGYSILVYRMRPHWQAYLALLYASEGSDSQRPQAWYQRAARHLRAMSQEHYAAARPWIEGYLASRPRIRQSFEHCQQLAGVEDRR